MQVDELVRYIARALVDDPDSIEVNMLESPRSGKMVLIELSAAGEDVGKLIGRKGRTADALRTIVSACQKDGVRYHLQINDD